MLTSEKMNVRPFTTHILSCHVYSNTRPNTIDGKKKMHTYDTHIVLYLSTKQLLTKLCGS